MKTLVIAALVVAAVGSPLPDDYNRKAPAVPGHSQAVPTGPHHGSVSDVAVPTVQHYAAIPVSQYQTSIAVSGGYVQPTAEVHQATAAFMSAWNVAAARATKIQSTLVKGVSAGTYVVQVPQQVQATEDVRRATAEFMAAWNEAARRASTVEHAMYSVPQPVRETEEVRQATAEFMSSWEAAAQQASAIRQAISYDHYSGAPEPVDHTDAVKKATAEFMAAWEEAAARVPKIESTMYTISGTVASPVSHHSAGSAPQFTPSVEQATADFMKAWNAAAAAAAAAPDTDIIMGGSSHSSSVSYQSPVAVSYSSDSAHASPVQLGVPQPVQTTPEVQRATAAFMAAWNEAAARATTIQSTLVKTSSTGHYTVEIPRQVKETDDVKRATAEFMAAWNEAASRATIVEHAMYSTPQPVRETEEVRQATAEFMSAWEAAAQQASAIRQALAVSVDTYSGAPEPVDHTDAVKKATAEFMAAWEEAAARVPKIESTMYTISGTVASPAKQHTSGSAPQFTPSVEQATAEFMKVWNAAAKAAAEAPDTDIIMGASSYSSSGHADSIQSPAAVSYKSDTAHVSPVLIGAPQPVQSTPEVQRATAAFMSAWNEAAARATTIQSTLVKTSATGHYTVEIPKQVKETDEVKRATAEFMAAWNEAASRVSTVEHAIYSAPQPVKETEEVRQATAEFMSAWKAAAQQASAIRQALTVSIDTYSGAPESVEHTDAVKKATAEFMAAWEEAAARVPKIESTMYTISGTVASPITQHTSGSAPQFTPSVEQATAEFMKAWNAAAAAAVAAPDTDIIMGASSHSSATQSASVQSPAAVSYKSATAHASTVQVGAPRPVKPTPEVQRATAAFMSAWNEAAARATTIQSTLVKTSSTGHYTVEIPKQVKETDDVKRATAEFMAAWNEAASRASTVEHAMYSTPQPVRETEEVRQATAEFMSAWEAAAQQASAIRKAISVSVDTYSGAPEPVDHTEAVKKATAEFMAAWEEAAARVPKIESTMYKISGTVASPVSHHTSGSVPQFTPSVEQATAEFMKAWNAAAAAAASAPDRDIITRTSSHPVSDHVSSSVTYATVPAQSTVQVGTPQQVKVTPEVQAATAAFMAAWNIAAERANKIQSTFIKSSSQGQTFEVPRQVEDTEAVKQASAEFMAAWNAAAQRGVVVEQAVSSIPQQVQETADVKKATAEFMSSWHTAAQQASAIRNAIPATVTYATHQSVSPTQDVQKATAQFLAAWNEAAARVPKIETTMYSLSGSSSVVSSGLPVPVVDTPEVVAAREAFMVKFREAEAAALRTPVNLGVLPVPTVLAAVPVHTVVYSTGAPHQGYTFNGRLFTPVAGLPSSVKVSHY